jgi:hypothetical protein
MNRISTSHKTRAVYQYSLDGTLIRRWDSLNDAARTLGIPFSSISSACSGKYHTAGNYKWKYCDEIDVFEGEEWRPSPYPEYVRIQISSFGRVRYPDGRITSGSISGHYKLVSVMKSDKSKRVSLLVHRLVAAAFYGPNNDKNIVVNHKDGNKMNNRADNLEYITRTENVKQ